MKLKAEIDIVAFLNQVKKCSLDVWLETEEGDRLNLKSVLSQYVFVVLSDQKGLFDTASVTFDPQDYPLLRDFLLDESAAEV